MLSIQPKIELELFCPVCEGLLNKGKIIWQGIHVCIDTNCESCSKKFISDLPVGHSVHAPFHVEKNNHILYGINSRKWLGIPLQQSFIEPNDKKINLQISKVSNRISKDAIILNCIDYLYGHALLKLLNSSVHLKENQYVIVIIQPFLTWLVPKGVSEIWEVDIELTESLSFYPDLDTKINKELLRFESVKLSKAQAHPKFFDIEDFSKISPFKPDKNAPNKQILFVWREERLWLTSDLVFQLFQKLRIGKLLVHWQRRKVIQLFKRLQLSLGDSTNFVVAGLGKTGVFPEWIKDQRVTVFNDAIESKLCDHYADSDLVIGVHGSNMLLPSAHAKMVLDIMPKDRWSNIAQDILYREKDSRMASFCIRYIPVEVGGANLSLIAEKMVNGYKTYKQLMMDDHL